MDDEKQRKRETLEVYSNLVRTEVKSLSGRMSEVSGVVQNFMSNLDSILMQIDELSSRLEALQNSAEFCKSELSTIKKTVLEHEKRLAQTGDPET